MSKIGPKEAQRIALRKRSAPTLKEYAERILKPAADELRSAHPEIVARVAADITSADEIERALAYYRKHRERQRRARANRAKAKEGK